MKMKLINESQILDPGFRKAVIEEITGTENVERKRRELRKYEIYRDMTRKWVVESLLQEGLKNETVRIMETRASNISIAKKIVNKLAQNYVHGVLRTIDDKNSQTSIDDLTKELDFNSKMDKADKYVQLFKNTLVGIIPENDFKFSSPEAQKFKLKMKVIPPYLYDAIEDKSDNEEARVIILTDFVERNSLSGHGLTLNTDGRGALGFSHGSPRFERGNRRDEIIADEPSDQGEDVRTFIWWSDKFHLTTDENGAIIRDNTPEDELNPIAMMPYISLAEDQDCEFWAQGGDDLIEGSVLINKLLTDMFSIANHQGWGQLVIAGKNATERKLEVGPHNALVFDVEEGDPAPSVTFASANPPLDQWMQMIEQYTALLLSTNNLSPRAVSNKLDSQSSASGIAMLIEKSESTADMKHRQKLFSDNEPVIWEAIRRWHSLFFERGALTPDFMAINTFGDSQVSLDFIQPQQIATEKDKLEEIRMRKDLGINTEIEIIQIDNPTLTAKEAEKKLLSIKEEKLNRMNTMAIQMQNAQGDDDGGDIQESEEVTPEVKQETEEQS